MTDHTQFSELSCQKVREGLSALLDGAVGVAEEKMLVQHIAHCSGCASYKVSLETLDMITSDDDLGKEAEDKIWSAVLDEITAQGTDQTADDTPVYQKLKLRNGAYKHGIAAVLLVGLLFGGWQIARNEFVAGPVLDHTLTDFAKFQSTGEVLDVAAKNPDGLLLWMSARVEFELPKHIIVPAGLNVSGGRLCSFLDRKLAFLSYSAGENDIGLYIANADGLDVPRDGNLSVQTLEEGGLTAVSWHQDDLVYVAVSDLPVGDLTGLADQFRKGGVKNF